MRYRKKWGEKRVRNGREVDVEVKSGMKVSVGVLVMIAENIEGWSLFHYLFASMHTFSVEMKAHEWIFARHSVNKFIVSAIVLLEQMQMTGVTGVEVCS